MSTPTSVLQRNDHPAGAPPAPGTTGPRRAGQDAILTTRVGLRMPPDLPFEQWRQAGPKLCRIADSSAWCLGDWLAHGQDKYGERYRRATQEAGLDYQTLRNYAWIARKFDIDRRRGALSLQHHAEVASLPREEQDLWLDRAEEGGWSRNELRRRLRGAQRPEQQDSGVMPRVRVGQENLERWRRAAQETPHAFSEWIVTTLDREAARMLSADGPSRPGERLVAAGWG